MSEFANGPRSSIKLHNKSQFYSGWYRICMTRHLERAKILKLSVWGGEARANSDILSSIEFEKDGQTRTLPAKVLGPYFLAWFGSSDTPEFVIDPIRKTSEQGWSEPFYLNWKLKARMLDITENAADMGHFTSVHIYKEHARLRVFSTSKSTMNVHFESARRLLGIRVPVSVELRYQGLGWVEGTIKTPLLDTSIWYTPTPIDSDHIHICMGVSYRKSWNPLQNKLFQAILPWEVSRDFERDIPIWKNKTTLDRPILCSEDGPILKLRRWVKQFSVP